MAYEIKTKETNASVAAYIRDIKDPVQKKDAKVLLKLLQEISKEKPRMWGSSMVGFGSFHYRGKTSEGEWPRTAFSARVHNMTLYIMLGVKKYQSLLRKLGPYKNGSSCLYIKRLSDMHLPTLKMLIKKSIADMDTKYPRKKRG